MITDEQRLARLVAMARAGRPAEAGVDRTPLRPPPGFATRVAAQWAAGGRGLSSAEAWERLSWWGTGLAAAACLLVVVFYQPAPEPTGFELLLTGTPVQPLF